MTKINVFIVQMSHRVRLSLFVYEVVTNMTAVNLEDISHFKKEFMNQCCVYTILQKSVIVGLHKNNNTICISGFFSCIVSSKINPTFNSSLFVFFCVNVLV